MSSSVTTALDEAEVSKADNNNRDEAVVIVLVSPSTPGHPQVPTPAVTAPKNSENTMEVPRQEPLQQPTPSSSCPLPSVLQDQHYHSSPSRSVEVQQRHQVET